MLARFSRVGRRLVRSAAIVSVIAAGPMAPMLSGQQVNATALAIKEFVDPLILKRLPPLSDGIEYRFMGRDLILRDAHANLIVDFIHEAVPTIRR